jgi:hypothetical protein
MPPPPSAPTVVSISPASGSGSSTTVTAAFSDLDGASDLATAELDIQSSLGVGAACLVSLQSGLLYLTNNAGTGLVGPVTPGSSGSASNSQCTISGSGASYSASGTTLTLTVPIVFSNSFEGTKQTYLYAADFVTGLTTGGWQLTGSWTVTGSSPPPPPSAPTVVSISPASGSGLSATLTATFSDLDGASNLATAELDIQSSLGVGAACLVSLQSGLLYLTNNAGTGLGGPVTPGSSGSASNSQCTISGSGASYSAPGTTLTITIPITFSSSFAGTKQIYLYAADSVTGLTTGGWQLAGSWNP